PTIGCVKVLAQTKGRSTVSARQSGVRPGTTPGNPLERRADFVVIASGTRRTKTVRCLGEERVVGSWSALAFVAEEVPSLAHIGKVKTRTVVDAKKVTVIVDSEPSLPFVPLAEVQVGAMCAT